MGQHGQLAEGLGDREGDGVGQERQRKGLEEKLERVLQRARGDQAGEVLRARNRQVRLFDPGLIEGDLVLDLAPLGGDLPITSGIALYNYSCYRSR